MNQGIGTIIYPVRDLQQAKAVFTALLGVEPYMDQPYYVGYKVGNQDIGLDPNGYNAGMTGAVSYYHVSDIQASVQALVSAGAVVQQEVKDVGYGKLTATLKDADGNAIGLIQMPS